MNLVKNMNLKKNFPNKYFFILLLVIVGFVLYANSFGNQMFWDDNDFILNNRFIKDWKYFPKFFSENIIAGAGFSSNYWRPVLLTVFSLEWRLWGDWAPGYHFVNICFHIGCAILLFLILFYVFKKYWLAGLTSIIFLIHPIQTEAVTYVNSLGDSLSVFFMFLGVFLYLKRSKNYIFWSLIMFALALMSKETAIIMPGILFICEFFYSKLNLKKALKAVWPFLVLAGVYILLRATMLNFVNTFNLYTEENAFTENLHFRIFTFFKVLTIYFGLLFWPTNLHMERSVEMATSLNSFPVIFGGIIFIGLLILALKAFKKVPVLSFGILWFFIGLAPTSNIVVPISGMLYEHWLYLPMIGIFLIVIWLGLKLAKKYKIQKLLLIIFIILSIILSIQTINRNSQWKDPITFYNQTLKHSPNSYRVINNLGMAYAEEGRFDKATKTYKRAIEVNSSNPVAYHNLANAYKNLDEKNLAIKNYKIAIELDPKFFFSYNALINIYLKDKKYNDALKYLEKFSELNPKNKEIKTHIKQLKNHIENEKNN